MRRPPSSPLNTIAPEDIAASASAFDAWLHKTSGDYVTLDCLTTVAGILPVLGNVITLVDAVRIVEGYPAKKSARSSSTESNRSPAAPLHVPNFSKGSPQHPMTKAPQTPGPAERMAAIHRAAQAAGTNCLDTKWLGCDHKYRFRCAQGHEWVRRADQCVLRAHCSRCLWQTKYNRENLERLREAMHRRGGACLSTEYLGLRAHYRFQCHCGHQWTAEGKSVLKGKACPACRELRGPKVKRASSPSSPSSKRHRRTPHEHLNDCKDRLFAALQAMAQAHGGHCLSEQYSGAGNYRFCCAHGHEWMASSKRVLAGGWCRLCGQQAWQERLQARRDGSALLDLAAALEDEPAVRAT